MKRFSPNLFIVAMLSVVAVAWLHPYPGTKLSPLHLDTLGDIGVALVFLLYGVQPGPQKLKAGLANIKLHLLIQISTFIIFPIIIILLKPLFVSAFLAQVWLPFFFLAALPSTVSSAVVMVSIAGGNIPAAIFNASISSMLGIFITPLWMHIFIEQAAGGISIIYVTGQLLLQVLLPLVIGLLLHKKLGSAAAVYKKELKFFDQSVILLIVYSAFCESFYTGAFSKFSFSSLLILLAMVLVLFFLVYGLISFVAKQLGFSREDGITATFCGSKKSLVHGSVMAKVLFTGAANTGLILLPLMLFHAMQLLIVSVIAGRLKRAAAMINAKSAAA